MKVAEEGFHLSKASQKVSAAYAFVGDIEIRRPLG